MKRSFNSTGRKKIHQDHVSFRVIRDTVKTPLAFTADLGRLSQLGLPDASRLYVEASIKHSSIRFDFGTTGSIAHPAECKLDELDRDHSSVSFRVMVVDETGHVGRLLASGDGFTDESNIDEGEGRKPLLPAEEAPLKQQIWDVQIDHTSGPRLLVNSTVPGLLEAVRKQPLLRGAIVPEAVRRVVRYMLEEAEDEAPWFIDWQHLLEKQLGLAPLDDVDRTDDDAIDAYIDDAVSGFADASMFATKALPEDTIKEAMYD